MDNTLENPIENKNIEYSPSEAVLCRKLQNKPMSVDKDLQYNSQDLDQEQNMDVKPVQLNTQNVQINVNQQENCTKIVGSTVLSRNKAIAAGANIYLFFGHRCKEPVYKTSSDKNGNFVIENIPPGYYTIYASLDRFQYESHFIKVLPHQTVDHAVLLG